MTLRAAAAVPPTVLLFEPKTATPELMLPSATVPLTSVPMKLPRTRLLLAFTPSMRTPCPPLPEMTLRSAAVVPPTVLFDAASIKTPLPALARTAVPVASVPMKLPAMVTRPEEATRMPCPPNLLIKRPRTVLPLVVMLRPAVTAPAPAPFNSTSGAPLKPGCVVPLMLTASATGGSAEVGLMVCGPPPPMLKAMTSACPGVELEVSMASRREQCAALHAPSSASSVVLTVSVEPAGQTVNVQFAPLLPESEPLSTATGAVPAWSRTSTSASENVPAPDHEGCTPAADERSRIESASPHAAPPPLRLIVPSFDTPPSVRSPVPRFWNTPPCVTFRGPTDRSKDGP